MTECIDPAAIEEGDLIAYVEGGAGDSVRQHVERCPACAGDVARLRETSRALVSLLYRADCPAPEILGQYRLDVLPSSRQLEVAAHVRTCPHCSRELQELAAEAEKADSLTQMVLHLLRDVVDTVEATVVPRRRPGAVGVRGREDRASTIHFRAADVDVLVGLQSGGTRPGRTRLLGTVVQADVVSGGQAWLFLKDQEPVRRPIDPLGTFIFEALPPGEYDLALELGRKAVLMRGLVV